MHKTQWFPHERTIGILGGGQLGRMLAMAAGRLGFFVIILDPVENCPAAQFANRHIVASHDDDHALQNLAKLCSIITYEFENIPLATIRLLEKTAQVFPDSYALEVSQDRLTEKRFIQSLKMKTAGFAPVSTRIELENTIQHVNFPAILKTRRFGYDGKGQLRLLDRDYLKKSKAQIDTMLESGCILESIIDFDCEISVIGARSQDGYSICYDPARNFHENGILVRSSVPCGLSSEIIDNAKYQTTRLMEKLNYVGVTGVEFFVEKSGNLLINEFSPRVHNSGHWTEAACPISQFEQHIRAITGLPQGKTLRHSDCQMQNLMGDSINQIGMFADRPNTLIHHYGKLEIRPNRKMGHITTISPKGSETPSPDLPRLD